jgi:hypothetical protein
MEDAQNLTPLQIKRLARSEAVKARLGIDADGKRLSPNRRARLEARRQAKNLTPPKPKPDQADALFNKVARERRLADEARKQQLEQDTDK